MNVTVDPAAVERAVSEAIINSAIGEKVKKSVHELLSVATEIGDTVVYLDLLAQRLGLSLEKCIRDTFNRVSEREGFPERLELYSGPGERR